MTADVVLLTRFNLPSGGVERFIRAEEGWLRDRVALFERRCLPSVEAQAEPDFGWLVYFDPQSPPWLRAKIDEWDGGLLSARFRATVSADELVSDIRDLTGASGTRLITANLDNDDAIATDFISRLRGVEPVAEQCAIYLATGLILAGGRTYLRHDPRNAFCAVSTSWRDPRTCWAEWHNRLDRLMPVTHVEGPPAWLQVIHPRNVSNRTRGTLVSSRPYQHLFPGQLDDVLVPRRGAVLADRIAWRPLRLVRDGGRTLLRRSLVRLLGRDGFDRLKGFVAGVARSIVPRRHRARQR